MYNEFCSYCMNIEEINENASIQLKGKKLGIDFELVGSCDSNHIDNFRAAFVSSRYDIHDL